MSKSTGRHRHPWDATEGRRDARLRQRVDGGQPALTFSACAHGQGSVGELHQGESAVGALVEALCPCATSPGGYPSPVDLQLAPAVLEAEAEGRSVVVRRSEPRSVRAGRRTQDGPVLLVPVEVGDQCVQHEIAGEDLEGRQAWKLGRGVRLLEDSPDRLKVVTLPAPLPNRVVGDHPAEQQGSVLQLPAAGRDVPGDRAAPPITSRQLDDGSRYPSAVAISVVTFSSPPAPSGSTSGQAVTSTTGAASGPVVMRRGCCGRGVR